MEVMIVVLAVFLVAVGVLLVMEMVLMVMVMVMVLMVVVSPSTTTTTTTYHRPHQYRICFMMERCGTLLLFSPSLHSIIYLSSSSVSISSDFSFLSGLDEEISQKRSS